jgi:hypothetical protein
MIIQKMNPLKLICLTLFLTAFLVPQNVEAQRKKKRKKDEIAAPVKPAPKKPKEKKISDLVKSSKEIDGLFKIYQDTITGSLQMVIAKDQVDKEYIYFSQIADGVADAGRLIRGAYRGSKVFKIQKYFNKIEFVTQNTSFYFDPENAISKSQDANTSEGTMASIKIEAFDKEKGLYLVKVNDLFLKETFAQIKPSRSPGQKPTAFTLGNLDKNKTKIEAINNYPENTNLKIEYVYSKSSTLNGGSEAVSDGRNVSVKVFHSLMEMPENDYEVRFDDPRVGYFATQVNDQTATGSVPYRDLIHRWKLIKKDPNAAISEPVEPITWWIENTTPLEWRETIKEGVLEWNKAFEKAGFKNAIVVKTQPDDATWDAGDIRYNVLRFTSSPKVLFGGYGPSFVNPRTGQILGADIMLEYANIKGLVLADKLYEDVDQLEFENAKSIANNQLYCSLGHLMNENIQFLNTALMVAGGTDLDLKRIKKEWWKATAMHEIGHTLGLMHNMKASQLYSPDQLADTEFIKGKALTASVMDYPAVHLTKDRTQQGQYFDMSLGPYDDWVIQFGYTPFESQKEMDDLLTLSTKPEHIFGNDADDMRSPGKAIDPRVMVGDLSNNPIGYSIDRIELVNSMMKDIKIKFPKKGESYQELLRAYSSLSRQRASAANVISRYIGGVYVDRAMVQQEGGTQPYTPVSLEDQKRAMNALTKYVFSPNAFKTPNELYNYLAMQRRGFDLFRKTEDPKIHKQILTYQKNVLAHILHPNTLQRITDSELYGNKYSLAAFMSDLNKAVFNADIYGNVNSFRQNLQLAYTNKLISMLTGKSKSSYPNMARSMALYNLKKIKAMSAASGNVASRAHKQHLRTLIDNAIKEIK